MVTYRGGKVHVPANSMLSVFANYIPLLNEAGNTLESIG